MLELLVEAQLIKWLGGDEAGASPLEVMRVAAVGGGEHRQAGRRGLQNNGAGGLVARGQHQAIGRRQQRRHVVAATEEANALGHPQRRGEALERPRSPGPRHMQAHARPKRRGQRRQASHRAIEPLGGEAGADQQEQQLAFAHAERRPHRRARLNGLVRRAFEVRRQRSQAFQRRAVDALVQGCLGRGDRQHKGAAGGREHGLFKGREVPIARRPPVGARPSRTRSRNEAGLAGVVRVEAGHLVHADQQGPAVAPPRAQHRGREAPLPNMPAQAARGQQHHFHAGRPRPAPMHGVNPRPMAAPHAFGGDLAQIQRQSAVREVGVDGEVDA